MIKISFINATPRLRKRVVDYLTRHDRRSWRIVEETEERLVVEIPSWLVTDFYRAMREI